MLFGIDLKKSIAQCDTNLMTEGPKAMGLAYQERQDGPSGTATFGMSLA